MDVIVFLLGAGDPRVPSFRERQSTGNTLRSYKLAASYFLLSLEPGKAGTKPVLNVHEREPGKRNRKGKLGRVRSRP